MTSSRHFTPAVLPSQSFGRVDARPRAYRRKCPTCDGARRCVAWAKPSICVPVVADADDFFGGSSLRGTGIGYVGWRRASGLADPQSPGSSRANSEFSRWSGSGNLEQARSRVARSEGQAQRERRGHEVGCGRRRGRRPGRDVGPRRGRFPSDKACAWEGRGPRNGAWRPVRFQFSISAALRGEAALRACPARP